MPESGKLQVYDDGRCAFCQWAEAWILRSDFEGRLEFRDYNQAGVAAETPFSFEQLNRKMHVRSPDGQWRAGYFGWIAIFSVLPKLRWLARVLSIAPLRWIGPSIYQFVANHRYRVPRFVLRCMGAPVPCPPAGCDVSGRERTGT